MEIDINLSSPRPLYPEEEFIVVGWRREPVLRVPLPGPRVAERGTSPHCPHMTLSATLINVLPIQPALQALSHSIGSFRRHSISRVVVC